MFRGQGVQISAATNIVPNVVVAWAALFEPSVATSTILHVDADASGANNGSGWPDAYNSLQNALIHAANSGGLVSEIWVAEGTYMPDGGYIPTGGVHVPGTGERDAAFQLLSDVALYGGFAGTETVPSERNVAANVTMLSGDLDADDTPVACERDSPDCDSFGRLCVGRSCIIVAHTAENSRHVVNGSGAGATAILDGFTITAGNADGPASTGRDAGGGLYNYSGSPSVADCRFIRSSAASYGGGMFNSVDSNPTVSGCVFNENTSTNGGAMANVRSSPTLTGSVFTHNAADNGGGVFNNHASPTITGCAIERNRANNGAGMYTMSGSPTLSGCAFNENLADAFGGGMYSHTSAPSVRNSAFNGNVADTGAGMYNWDSTPIVTDSVFHSNSADGGAGMANILGQPAVISSNFTGNLAIGDVGYGGAMYNNGATVVLLQSTFAGNVANHGAGIFDEYSSPTLTGCTFRANTARSGGAMLNIYWSFARITNCAFVGNSATAGGGGAIVDSSHSDSTLTNSTFTRNTADSGGGAIAVIFDSDSTMTNCTFWNNTAAHGGALEAYENSYPTVANSILWGNTDANVGGPTSQIGFSGGWPTVMYSIVQGGWAGGGIGVFDADPMFVDASAPDGVPAKRDDDLRLMPGSPAIDMGDNTALPRDRSDLDRDADTTEPIPIDLDGHVRVLCGRVDMGAYEFGIGDFNCDRVTELADFAAWPDCMTAPVGEGHLEDPLFPDRCEAFEFHPDGAIDLADFAGYQHLTPLP
jgi:hypothetical protein